MNQGVSFAKPETNWCLPIRENGIPWDLVSFWGGKGGGGGLGRRVGIQLTKKTRSLLHGKTQDSPNAFAWLAIRASRFI